MNINAIGQLGSQLKNMKMENYWNMKKASGDITEKTDLNKLDKTKEPSDKVQKEEDTDDETQVETKDKKAEAIIKKLRSGKKLSAEEFEYLRKNNPEKYQEAKRIEASRQAAESDSESDEDGKYVDLKI